jgi:hypothetical protein
MYQYPVVTFDHFVLFEQSGQILQTVASELARRMYSRHAPRYLLYDINEMSVCVWQCRRHRPP